MNLIPNYSSLHCLYCCTFNTFFSYAHMVWHGTLVPQPGFKPTLLHWKHRVWTTRLPGKSFNTFFLKKNSFTIIWETWETFNSWVWSWIWTLDHSLRQLDIRTALKWPWGNSNTRKRIIYSLAIPPPHKFSFSGSLSRFPDLITILYFTFSIYH